MQADTSALGSSASVRDADVDNCACRGTCEAPEGSCGVVAQYGLRAEGENGGDPAAFLRDLSVADGVDHPCCRPAISATIRSAFARNSSTERISREDGFAPPFPAQSPSPTCRCFSSCSRRHAPDLSSLAHGIAHPGAACASRNAAHHDAAHATPDHPARPNRRDAAAGVGQEPARLRRAHLLAAVRRGGAVRRGAADLRRLLRDLQRGLPAQRPARRGARSPPPREAAAADRGGGALAGPRRRRRGRPRSGRHRDRVHRLRRGRRHRRGLRRRDGRLHVDPEAARDRRRDDDRRALHPPRRRRRGRRGRAGLRVAARLHRHARPLPRLHQATPGGHAGGETIAGGSSASRPGPPGPGYTRPSSSTTRCRSSTR